MWRTCGVSVRQGFMDDRAVYLDSAASPPVDPVLVQTYATDLSSHLLSNPHSQSPSAQYTHARINGVRSRILKWFGSQEYFVVFTQNSTRALEIVARCVEWRRVVMHRASHTSVAGIASLVAERCGNESVVIMDSFDHVGSGLGAPSALYLAGDCTADSEFSDRTLAVFPAQCNFSGRRYPLQWVNSLKESGARVLVDTASYLSTSRIDLTRYPADFAVVWFYKIFGFPTGLGALLVRKDAAHLFSNTFVGGGTVDLVVLDPICAYQKQDLSERLETGTLPFQEIIALHSCFAYMESRFDKDWLRMHTLNLTLLAREKMHELVYPNAVKLVVFYPDQGRLSIDETGPIIAFNLVNSDSSYIGYSQVMKLAASQNIHLRSGCFCNPGACQMYLGLTREQAVASMRDHGYKCGGKVDLVNGVPMGALRISFGHMSEIRDLDAWIAFLNDNFISSRQTCARVNVPLGSKGLGTLSNIVVYPVKSCRGMQVNSSVISPSGLLNDRRFKLIDIQSKTLTQKKCGLLCTVNVVDQGDEQFILSASGMDNAVFSVGDLQDASDWFSVYLKQSCTLVLQPELAHSHANTSQYLLVSQSSINLLNDHLSDPVDHRSFRPNFVVDGLQPFIEQEWVGHTIRIGRFVFSVHLYNKGRCHVRAVPDDLLRPRDGSEEQGAFKNACEAVQEKRTDLVWRSFNTCESIGSDWGFSD